MLSTVVASLLLAQTGAALQLPPGVHPEVARTVAEIEGATRQGNWERARRLATLLPDTPFTVELDDRLVPAANRAEFRKSVETALAEWRRSLSAPVRLVPKGGFLRISYNDVLARNATTGLPAGVALFWGVTPGKPRLEAVIGLRRGNPLQPTEPFDILNDTLFAVGTALGHAEDVFGTGVMVRRDLPVASRLFIVPTELNVAGTTLTLSRSIRERIAAKKPIQIGRARLITDTPRLDADGAVQGDKVEFTVQFSNQGTAPLSYRLFPDCGCVTTDRRGGVLAAGSTDLLKVMVDTTEFPGVIAKRLKIISNDPSQSIRVIPISVQSRHLYRFLSPGGMNFVLDEGQRNFEFFLSTDRDAPLRLGVPRLEGLPGEVKVTPWRGTMADPELNQGPSAREGYKINVTLAPNATMIGRMTIAVALPTDSPQFPTIRGIVGLQRGIVALPERIFWGEIGTSPKQTKVILSRPGRRFQIRKVTSSTPHLTVTARTGAVLAEHDLVVRYRGTAPSGPLRSVIRVETDDPRQGTITIPVEATVQ